MNHPIDDDAIFEQLAAKSDPLGLPVETPPRVLKEKISASLVSRQQDDRAFETLAAGTVTETAPPSLKSRIYSALVSRQAESGSLLGLSAVKACGRGLCVWEEILVHITPISANAESFNLCRICHARVLAEHMDSVPLHWRCCPYAKFQGR